MKKVYLIIAAAFSVPSYAQELVVKANATLMVSSGTDLYFSGLTLTPSANLVLSGQTLEKDTAVSNSFGSTYVSSTYRFSDTPVFSGNIRMQYPESTLNGLNESSLQLAVYNGTSWQAAGTSTSNTTDNYVQATGIAGIPLGELILTNGAVLPMEWGDVSALRQGAAVKVQWYTLQERNIDHFDVERSTDGLAWSMAIAAVKATNKPSRTDYEQTDMPGYYGRLYYRIRYTDRDGRFAFSKTVSVAPVNTIAPIFINPNPANSHFMLSGIAANDIRKVDMINTTGSLVRTWKGGQMSFNISGLPAGVYYLRITIRDGYTISLPLSVR